MVSSQTRQAEDRGKHGVTLGLIGLGAIARAVITALVSAPLPPRIVVLRRAGSSGPVPFGVEVVTSLDALLDTEPAAVLEVASQAAAEELVPAILSAQVSVVMASTGALANPSFARAAHEAARRGNVRLLAPAGALGGTDYLRAIARLPDTRLRYTSRKPPAAWEAELAALGHNPQTLSFPVQLFEGSADVAARLYPRNLNAALTVALAAPSASLTVRVVADPTATGNTHEIEAESSAGTAFLQFVNTPAPDNPKTSRLTALSLLAALEDLLYPN